MPGTCGGATLAPLTPATQHGAATDRVTVFLSQQTAVGASVWG